MIEIFTPASFKYQSLKFSLGLYIAFDYFSPKYVYSKYTVQKLGQ